ncbi:Ni/Fe hydrogenase subunit alpha [Ectothiorhodospiraceae bacterium WFHF3C12]|nr:Ni/Fe hydrogenase subunit alpha [Ectothiorhodospiraceae bacterium WFHF3C12]
MTTRTIDVDYIARVEGEGALYIRFDGDRVDDVQLRIFEPPRFFEALLRGRAFTEAPDITARICGICPVAYLMSACHAMEMACGVTIDPEIRALRRLLYCGEWIESHVLHIYMLHAPDFLGYPDAISMAKDYPETVRNALRLKKIGNQLMTVLGGREIHPINVRVGGFYKAPSRQALDALVPELEWARDQARETVRLVAGLPFPDFEQDYEFVALRQGAEYPFNEGGLASTRGIDVPISEYDDVLHEQHLAHSTSLHTRTAGGGVVHMGPMARYALNRELLGPGALAAAEEAGLGAMERNPFRSIIVRAVEVVFAVEEALRLIGEYREPDRPAVPVEPRAGTGYGATEAPRGICYHRYTIDDDGLIQDAKIVAPTSVNQGMIESDLRAFVAPRVDMADDALRADCEQLIRNYDPCISCSAHFLKLEVERG